LRRRGVLLLSVVALVLALLVYWLLLLLEMEGWAEIWLAGILSCLLTLVCFWLVFRLLDYSTRRRRSRELFKNQCPLCGAPYPSKLKRCPNCLNPS
jgi:hypothetical protein